MRSVEIRQQILSGAQKLRENPGLQKMAINAAEGQPSYYNANEAFLNFYPELRAAMLENTNGQRTKLSPGISTLPTFSAFTKEAQNGIALPDYYVNYSAPFGTTGARDALRRLESANVSDTNEMIYPPDGIFITPGATGAVNLAFEYVKQTYPDKTAAVLGLSYYVFPFIAKRVGMECDVLITDPLVQRQNTRFLPSPEEVKRSVRNDTKLLVVTQPSNPTGEYYSRQDIKKLVDLAIEKDLLILSDNVFSDLVYDQDLFETFEKVAYEKGALDRVLTVRSYSKNYNIPGLRIGYLATSSSKIGQEISFINERIMCCPPTVSTPLIHLASLMQNIDLESKRFPDKSIGQIVKGLNSRYNIGQGTEAGQDFEKLYTQYKTFMKDTLQFYGENFDRIQQTLGDAQVAGVEKNAAFNTIVKLGGISKGTNFFDFCANLYLTTGIETQIGPCFGLTQKKWEEDLGFWLRVTYTLQPEELENALKTLLVFREEFLKNPDLFMKTELSF